MVPPTDTGQEYLCGRKMDEVLKKSLWFLCIFTWNYLLAFLKRGNVQKRYLLWITSLSGTEYSQQLNLCSCISTLDFLPRMNRMTPWPWAVIDKKNSLFVFYFMLRNESTATYKCICEFTRMFSVDVSTF